MMNPEGREAWFQEFMISGLKFRSGTQEQVEAWARSMSLIAEQFIDNREETTP